MVKVSVIMPVYNGESFLQAAVESLFSQTFDQWELVIVDDGSTDQTPEILNRFEDPRIVKIWQNNSGEAAARNTGLDHAIGEYIAFLDADDLFLPDRLLYMTDYIDGHPEYGVIFSNGYICDKQGKVLSQLSEIRPGIYTGDILEPLVLNPSVVSVPVNTMARLSIIKQNNIRFDTRLTYGTDWDFWIQLARITKFGYLDKLTCIYRVHESNMTRTASRNSRKDEFIKDRMKVLESGWFNELSEKTRQHFFYIMLMDLLSGRPDQQTSILMSHQFQQLSDEGKATLWRRVGVDLLLSSRDYDKSLEFIRRSVSLSPHNRKSKFLLWAWKLGPTAAAGSINIWKKAHRVYTRAIGPAQRQPKPIPKELNPYEYL